MTSKNSSAKRTPRAMPVETIITRYKSAQQKKLQEPQKKKEIKNNKKNKITKKAVQPKSENKITIQEIKQIIQNHEFYPNRHKRDTKRKKIVLIPKHCMKMVGGTKSSNKRKLHTPRKETSYIKHPPNDSITKMIESNSNISFPELIRVIEESGSLNDEDFLEILTCPSPVWWEDPPHGYIEEPLYTKSPKDSNQIETKPVEKTENNYNIANDIVINVDERGKNFIKKRGKLESLLKNIRTKVNQSDAFDVIERCDEKRNSCTDDDQTLEIRDDEILTNLENIKIPIEKDGKTEYDEEYLDMSYFEDDYIGKETKSNETQRYFKDIQKDTKEAKDKDKEEYVAVYKIIESDDDVEINDGVVKNKQINDYYSQKKFRSASDCECFKNKSIKVSDSVKYCMNCSSINDTDDCKYCMGKLMEKCVCSKYTCDVCKIKMNSKNKIIKHLKNHV